MTADLVIQKLFSLEGTDAVLLGGSRASGNQDPFSDYDVYVYYTKKPDEEKRRQLLEAYCTEYEVGNCYWEYEDNCTLNDGIGMDIIYRSMEDFEKFYSEKLFLTARNGYSTCFLHNLVTSRILYDKSGRITKIQEALKEPLPDTFFREIIDRNMRLLHGKLPSYDKQIKKAVERGDLVSVNHRTAGFMESYFDVIFALNKMTHPGEKKLVKICKEKCEILPSRFEENIRKLFASMYVSYDFETLNDMIAQLQKTVDLYSF